MQNFTPLPALAGGILIGLSASLLLLVSGKVAGISGILAGLVRLGAPDRPWRWAFVAGLAAAALGVALAFPSAFGASPRSLPLIAIAGLLVGFGTRLGGGCTSGHGVCGLSRLSKRSLAATLTFMATGAVTVVLSARIFGGAP